LRYTDVSFLKWLCANRSDHEASPEPAADEEVDPYNPFPEPVTLEIRDVIDLHTIPPRDVKRVVEEYLCEAQRLDFPEVRIIHGKGIGVQREMVRTILARTAFVIDWTDAPPEAGGLGATIVRFKRK
jgi:dsDNA-specific endonuclease/ATPase MutS2